MINITDEDIEKVERKFDLIFDNESKAFIKCMESKDIQACPGAGKTTSLVAKLDILANYMPFKDNSGILVLTHTNVAVDEIKKKLGANARVILNYPNYVGTFQSFIDKYLAIPMYIKIYGKKPERIDSEIFENLFYTKLSHNTRYGLNEKFKRQATNQYEKEMNVKAFLKSFYINENNKLKRFDGKVFEYKNNPPSKTYKELLKIKKEMLENGILSFSDCYYFAIKYLSNYPNIINIFQKRFKYIFIDEAQDTDDRQFEILDKLFKNSNTIIQKIGDNNQAIYNFAGQVEKGWNISNNLIEIKNTKRLSSLISKQVEKVAISKQKLNGNKKISIKPHIIIFNDDNIEQVIPKFVELLIKYNLHNIENAIFKAVGGVAKINDEGHTIPSYFPDYKKDNNCFSLYDTLLEKTNNCFENRLQLSEYRNIVLDIIKEYLKSEEIYYFDKPFTKRTIVKYLKEYDINSYSNFKLELFNSVNRLIKNKCIKDELINILNIILEIEGTELDISKLNNIIKNYKYNKRVKAFSNVYKRENIEVQISTIHKVKGETHTATLVLETFKDGYDIYQVMDYLKGSSNKLKIDNKKRLLYVAMSRPTHLLCLALHKKHIYRKKEKLVTDKDIELLRNCGFEIVL